MSLPASIESILFVASKPLPVKAIARAVGKREADVADAIETLKLKYNRDDSGLRILTIEDGVQMGTNPAHTALVDQFVKNDAAGELTRAQLETLTVIAYRGPVTRPELEQIRGVNCAIIVRNLLIRGLIEEEERADALHPLYRLSFDALRHLGVSSVEELPEYATLHHHEYIQAVMEQAEQGDE